MTRLAAEGRDPVAAASAGTIAGSPRQPSESALQSDESARHNDSALHAPDPAGVASPLTVTGMDHVIAVLEQLENGLLTDVTVVEPYACAGGCFGSPLLSVDFHVATHRWAQDPDPLSARVDAPAPSPRRRPFTARPGIRLDSNMGRAIERLGRLQALARALPGKDCGTCGAPTCAALAEDVVIGRATADLCPYV